MQLKSISAQKAFTLFEVLVMVVILAIGMLGISSMLLIARKSSNSNYLRQEAIQLAFNIIETMRTNRNAAIDGDYNVSNISSTGKTTTPSAPSSNCFASTCNQVQIANYDTWNWLANEVTMLPDGTGSIQTTPSGTSTLVTVTIQWNDAPAQAILGSNGEISSVNSNYTQFSIETIL